MWPAPAGCSSGELFDIAYAPHSLGVEWPKPGFIRLRTASTAALGAFTRSATIVTIKQDILAPNLIATVPLATRAEPGAVT